MPSLPSVHFLRCILHAFRSKGFQDFSMSLHTTMCANGMHAHPALGNHLISMWVASECMEKAAWVFDKLIHRTNLSWNSLIIGYVKCGNFQHALNLYQGMQELCVYPNECTLLALLKVCAQLKDEKTGSSLHAEIARRGLEEHLFVSSSLVDMYAKCDTLERAQETLEKLPIRDTVTWNALIAGYIRLEHYEEALLCLKHMQLEGRLPSVATFVSALKACGLTGDVEEGEYLHTEIARMGLENDPHVGSTLVDMYANCGLLMKAHEVLDSLLVRHAVAWNALLGGYVNHDHNHEALLCYESMQLEGIIPNAITFVCCAKASGSIGDPIICQELHGEVATMGLENDVFVGSALVDMYANCGMLDKAHEVLKNHANRNVVMWNALITGYIKHGFSQESLDSIGQMHDDGFSPSTVTYASGFKACGDIKATNQGQELHIEMVKKEMEGDIFLGSSLVDMYANIGLLCEAQDVFNKLPTQNVVSWTALIGGYAKHGLDEEALEHLEHMQVEGVFPNTATYACSLKACSSLGARDKGIDIHVEIARKGLESDLIIGNALVDMYSKSGIMKRAHEVFCKLPTQDVVSWNALIGGYAKDGHAEEALNLFAQMQTEGISADAVTYSCVLNACGSTGARDKGQEIHREINKAGLLKRDLIVGNALVDMYANCGLLSEAQEVFDNLPSRDVVSWTTLIAGYVNHERHEEALHYFELMEPSSIFPNAVTFVSGLKACGSVGSTDKGQRLHAEILRKGLLESDLVGNSLVDLYVKCGLLSRAHEVFDKLFVRDEVSWNVLIAGHAHSGTSDSVFCILHKMIEDGKDPNTATVLSVLNACSHAGVVEKGLAFFESMAECYGIVLTLEHYNCMADLFARAGQVDKAITIIREMPFHPNHVVWHTIMNACRIWGNLELGLEAFEHAVQMDDKDTAAFLCILKIYRDANSQDDTSALVYKWMWDSYDQFIQTSSFYGLHRP